MFVKSKQEHMLPAFTIPYTLALIPSLAKVLNETPDPTDMKSKTERLDPSLAMP
jgi:hypothetical protein